MNDALHTANEDETWWRNAVVYQVYPRSFADANGDGTGDVAGIISRLDHLATLGVDAIWISPWYPSPLLDGGYDVVDYRDIDPRFGTLDDARRLTAEAHARGIKIIVDIVPNHTSSGHRWFQEAIASPIGAPSRDRYIIRSGKGPDGAEPPNNWVAVFGGSTWSRLDDGEWYLHLFDVSQPDLDWNHPEVRAEFRDIFRFWIDLGVDGFRIDVAHGLVKHPDFPDVEVTGTVLESENLSDGSHPFWDRDGVHEIIREWRAVLDEAEAAVGRDLMMVAEAWVHPTRLPLYLRPDEYHQSFNFDFLTCGWDAEEMRGAIDRALDAANSVGSTPTWALSNHDVVRHATRYGLPDGTPWRTWVLDGPHDILDPELGLDRARAATLLLLALPGSTYLYQGEELGLPEAYDLPVDVLDDPVWENSGHTVKGRDGCRVPIPWESTGPSLGFGNATPWLPQPAVFAELAADQQTADPESTLNLYRRGIELRRSQWVGAGPLEWLDLGTGTLAFRRGAMTCVINLTAEPIDLPAGSQILGSGPPNEGRLGANRAVWLND
ncbi:MAG: glycoside hydrolase family 13 protein [Ilumatobacteraceae bacterium]